MSLLTLLESIPPPPVPTPPAQNPAATPVVTPTPVATFGEGLNVPSLLLSTIIWAPVIVAVVMALFPQPKRPGRQWQVTAFFTIALSQTLLAFVGYVQFQSISGFQYEEKLPWLPALGAGYHMSVDGIGILMLLLSSWVGLAAILGSGGIRERQRSYFVLLLLVQSGFAGAIAAHDSLLLLLFLAATIVPLGLLVQGWGGRSRVEAARSLVVWLGLGTACIAAAMALVYLKVGGQSFDFDILFKANLGWLPQNVAAALLVVGVAFWLPLVPFHAGVRRALAEAPPGVAMLLTGTGSRLAAYVLLRGMVGGLHQGSRHLAPYLGGLAALTVLYAAVGTMRHADIRRSAAHLAMVPGAITALGVSGLTPISLDGAVLSLLAGGAASALIVGAGAIVAERGGTGRLVQLGGLFPRMQMLGWLLVLGCLAIIGVPAFLTSVAEMLAIFGSIQSQPVATFVLLGGLALTAVAAGWLLYRVLLSAPVVDAPPAGEAGLAEKWCLGLLAGWLMWFGLFPSGPKLGGIPLLDPGVITVVNAATGDLSNPYVPPAPPAPPTGQ